MSGFIGLSGILLIGLVVLLVFGAKRLPEVGRSVGHGLREFKDSVTGPDAESDDDGEVLAAADDEVDALPTQSEQKRAA